MGEWMQGPTHQQLGQEAQMTIGFDVRDRRAVLDAWSSILASQRWTEGPYTSLFEERWSAWNGLRALAFSSWSGAAAAALEYIDVRGETVLCPSNTYMATPISVLRAGGKVQFVDCNRHDLCISAEDFRRKAEESHPKAAWVVHIGGHVAFEIDQIADYCTRHGIWLLEDCAHAHGASWGDARPGSWGLAGVYSFYATKTITTGEGGMLVSSDPELLRFAAQHRNYGRPDYTSLGQNSRISEFAAALGAIQVSRMDEIVAWKQEYARRYLDPQHTNRVRFPDGMTSGLYKYIVFDPIPRSTGLVYRQPCHRLLGHRIDLPVTDWVASHHWCVPLYYRPTSFPSE
jgi:perosamine synthetase